ncbi:MAG: ABC transporter ATP-binding protein [Herpetosiphonaceae bacterium]|nr:ABC transporter ATP-binding protein [Herpetosiphonaceae bacterium]
MTPKINIDSLQVIYPGRGRNMPVEALAGVSLAIADGELVCVVGPSGCGKTTLLRILADLEQPTTGQAIIAPDESNRPLKGMVFQGAGLFPWMTVAQNVAYGLQLRGVAPRERLTRAQHWITTMGLERFAQSYPAQLSGGMQQRAGLARAFTYDPQVLLMDEPFGALDAQTRLILQATLLDLWEQARKTVVFVTHSIEEALTLGDRVVLMSARPGRILHEVMVPFARPRDPITLRTDPRFSALFAEVWGVLRAEVEHSRTAELEMAP